MSASVDDSTRDRHTIERELRLLASVRSAYRQRGGALPPVTQMDALLDELLELGAPVAPKAKANRPVPSRSR
ncbi:MAG: hypothetical protein WAN71_05585 [Mycobacterium sp.]|uniref:hypothetical protein n=1 Tax=Mycobacterium sp. TaxID=1785 RepID=UPI003BAE6E54